MFMYDEDTDLYKLYNSNIHEKDCGKESERGSGENSNGTRREVTIYLSKDVL